MSFKHTHDHHGDVTLLAYFILCALTCNLVLTGALSLYVHPRYTVFTMVLAVIGLLVTGYGLLRRGIRLRPPKRSVPIGLVILLAVTIAPQALSARSAATRGYDATAKQVITTSYDAFSSDLSSLTIEDWASIFNSPTKAKLLIGKKARVSGFVIPDGRFVGEAVIVSRFVVSCCTVDARTIGVSMLMDTKQLGIETGNWVTAEAEVAEYQGIVLLRATNVQKIDPPENQYVF